MIARSLSEVPAIDLVDFQPLASNVPMSQTGWVFVVMQSLAERAQARVHIEKKGVKAHVEVNVAREPCWRPRW
jgi:hypothetical protein